MSEPGNTSEALARADALCQILATAPSDALVAEAAALLGPLRNAREFARLCDLAELVCRHRAGDATAWRLHAQGLIETRRLTVAIALLNEARRQFGAASKEADEFDGLLGRAYKQLLMDTPDAGGELARGFLHKAIEAYAAPYERNPVDNFWHGVNLAALAHAAAGRGLSPPKTAPAYLGEVLARLGSFDAARRDCWWYATKAEAHAGLGEWPDAEEALFAYLEDAGTSAFSVGSTLRQWRDVWRLQDRSALGARLIQVLEARLMRWPQPGGVTLAMAADHLVQMRELQPKDDAHLQRAAGPAGFEALKWYRTGLERAASVAAVSELCGLRFGTGFAVRAADLGVAPGDEILLLTNHHVVNSGGFGSGGGVDAVEIVFEAATGGAVTLGVKAVVAESPVQGGLDYALLRLAGETGRVEPLQLTRSIVKAQAKARVYLIGYPLGDVMQFSMHDNVLLDHECEPTGRPTDPARRLLHYSASSEKGNSGSPVFDEYWRCIGLHHAGGRRNPRLEQYGLPALNGANRTVDANQGIWIGSIQDHVGARRLKLGG